MNDTFINNKYHWKYQTAKLNILFIWDILL